jgi:acetate kinase
MRILVANIGSTSFKYRVFDMASATVLAQGRIERIGRPGSDFPDYESAIRHCLAEIVGPGSILGKLSELDAIAFKAVHAGPVSGARFVDQEVLAAMEQFSFLAPAHNPPYLAAMRAFQAEVPDVPLVALFETAFFDRMDEAAATYAVPLEWKERYGVRRYGFHGASHRAASERVIELLGTQDVRHISCHLGGSSSVAAIRNGVAVDTSFGMSPQSGIPQNNRAGDLDPFAVLYMMKQLALGPDAMADVLAEQSGLAGLGGGDGDVRHLEQAADRGEVRAKLALDTFVFSVRRYVGALFVSLGGLDVLSFSGGIGENSPRIRAEVCGNLGCLGVSLDEKANAEGTGEAWIHSKSSAVKLLVVPADEERIVARAAAKLLGERGAEALH